MKLIKLISIFILTILVSNIYSQNNIKKGSGIIYTAGVPTVAIDTDTDSEWAVDTTNNKNIYLYDRDAGAWIKAGYFIQQTLVLGVPTHTPHDAQSVIAINEGDSLFYYRSGSWRLISGGGSGSTDLTIGGSGPDYTILSSTGTDVTISGAGIITLSESPANTLIITGTEVDGSITNEIQQIDTFEIANDSIRLSLSSDGVLYKKILINDNSKANEGSLVISGSSTTVTLSTNTIGSPTQTWLGSGNVNVKDSASFSVIVVPNEVDGSVTNEGLISWSVTTNLLTLASNTSGSETFLAAGRGGIAITDSSGTLLITGSGGSAPNLSYDATNHEVDISGGGTSATIPLGLDDGATEGLASFTAADFTVTSGNVAIDYTNGQAASGSTKGFLTSADWTTFNNKGSGDVLNNGNTFGAAFNIGPDDNNLIALRIQDTTALNIATTQIATFIINTSNTNTVTDQVYFDARSYNTPAANFGTSLMFKLESTTTESVGASSITTYWTDATHATNEAAVGINLADAGGALTEVFKIDRTTNTGKITFGTSSPNVFTTSGLTTAGNYTIDVSTNALSLTSARTGGSGVIINSTGNNVNASTILGDQSFTTTSGNKFDNIMGGDFAPTSGTGTFNNLYIVPTINQTGGANGITGGLRIGAILTAVADFRAIQVDVNNTAAWAFYQDGTNSPSFFAGQVTFDKQLKLKEISAPSTPASGYGALYAFTDDSLYYINNAGTSINLCRSSGSGGSYTNEDAQDAIGAMINASLQYVDGTPLLAINDRDWGPFTSSGSGLTFDIDNLAIITADLNDSLITEVKMLTNSVGSNAIKANSVDASELVSTAVTPGSYTFTSLTVDADGRITSASSGSEVDGSVTNEGLIAWSVTTNLATLTSNTTGSETLLMAGRNGLAITDSSGYMLFTQTSGAGDGNGIYTGNGTIANSLNADMGSISATDYVFFGHDLAAEDFDATEYGLRISSGGGLGVTTIWGADSIAGVYTLVSASDNITLSATNNISGNGASINVLPDNYVELSSTIGAAESYLRIVGDSMRLITPKVHIHIDSTTAIGYFPGYPSINFDGREKGLLWENGLMAMYGGDFTKRVWSNLALDELPTLQVGNEALSKRAWFQADTTYTKMHTVNGADDSDWIVYADSIYGESEKLRIKVDSLFISANGSYGTVGQILKVNANGSLTFAADATGGGGLSDGDYGDIIVSSSSTVLTVDANAITSSKIAANTIVANDVDDDFIILQNGNTIGAGFRIGSNDNFSTSLEVQDSVQLVLNTDWTSMFNVMTSTTNALVDGLYIGANSYNTAAAGFGTSLMFKLESSTTNDQGAATIGAYWTTATHASREAALTFQLGDNAGSLAEMLKLDRTTSTGLMSLGTTTPLLFTISSISGQADGGLIITGGDAVGDSLVYIPTTANGTDASGAHVFKVDNNGGTTAMTIRNNGLIGIGTTSPATRLSIGPISAAAVTLAASATDFVGVSKAGGVSFIGENTSTSSSTTGSLMALVENDGAAMASGDRLGGFLFGGSSSSSAIRATAGVFCFAEETWVDGTDYGTGMRFETTTNDGTTRAEKWRIANNGAFSNTSAAGTAYIELKAGTTTIPPIRLTSGTSTTTPLSGAIEYDGTKFYGTNGSTIRYVLIKGYTSNATLNFPSTLTMASSDLTISVTGAADGDAVAVGPLNAQVSANGFFTAWVSATNTVTVRFFNLSGSTVDPGSGDYQVTVFKPNN